MKAAHTTIAIGLLYSAIVTDAAQAACKPWVEMQADQLRIVSALPEDDTRQMAKTITRFAQVISSVASSKPDKSSTLTTLFVLRNADWPLPSGGVFQRGYISDLMVVPEPREFLQTPYVAMLHEYVHSVMINNGGADYPPWYQEGMAEVLSGVLEVGDNIRLGLVYDDQFRPLRNGNWIPLKELLELTHDDPRVRHGTDEVFYAMSTVLVHYLVIGNPQRKVQMESYLQLIHQGIPSSDAFRTAFQVDVQVVEKELRAYVNAERIKYITLPRSAFPGSQIAGARALPCVDALSETAMALTRLRVEPRTVRSKWIERAAKEDPKHPAVLVASALSFEASNDPAAADQALQTVVQSPTAEPRWKWLAAQTWMDRARDQTRNFNAPPADAGALATRAATILDDTQAGSSKDAHALYALGMGSLLMGTQNDRGLAAIAAASHLLPTSAELAWVGAVLSERANRPEQAAELWAVVAWYGQTADMRNRARDRRAQLTAAMSNSEQAGKPSRVRRAP